MHKQGNGSDKQKFKMQKWRRLTLELKTLEHNKCRHLSLYDLAQN